MLFKSLCIARFFIIAAFSCAGIAHADAPPTCQQNSRNCVEVGQWQLALGVGLGLRTNPVIDGETIPLILLPEISYYGERFFLDNLDIGYTLHQSDTQMLNMLLTPGYDQLFFSRWDPQNFFVETTTLSTAVVPSGMLAPQQTAGERWTAEDRVDLDDLHERRMAAMAGFEYAVALGPVDGYAQALQDVAAIHNGHELRLGLGKSWQRGGNDFALAGGAIWQSAELLHYYYGVETSEVSRLSAAYRAPSGISGFIKLDWSRPVSEHWSWRGTLQYKKLSTSITDSPIVNDDKVITAFLGGVYHF